MQHKTWTSCRIMHDAHIFFISYFYFALRLLVYTTRPASATQETASSVIQIYRLLVSPVFTLFVLVDVLAVVFVLFVLLVVVSSFNTVWLSFPVVLLLSFVVFPSFLSVVEVLSLPLLVSSFLSSPLLVSSVPVESFLISKTVSPVEPA